MQIQGPVFGLLALEIEAHDSWAAFALPRAPRAPVATLLSLILRWGSCEFEEWPTEAQGLIHCSRLFC